jgi:hypothetical protein
LPRAVDLREPILYNGPEGYIVRVSFVDDTLIEVTTRGAKSHIGTSQRAHRWNARIIAEVNEYNETAEVIGGTMSAVEITIQLPEALVKQATELGILSSEHIEFLLRAESEAQLAAMARDAEIQREMQQIETEFSVTELDGLDQA